MKTRDAHARQIIAFRNILVHGYGEIANEIVWSTAREDVPLLWSIVGRVNAVGAELDWPLG